MSALRKLAAILAVDVVGYSSLMGEDEAGTALAVREHRKAARPIVANLGGRIVKTMGDGLLLEFPSVVAAVECAIAIQKLMVKRNAEAPKTKRIVYRMGVNLGDVLIEGDDILGDGVNIAARLEGLCEPGGLLIAGSAFDNVRGKIDANFVDLGEKNLKNIARPVRTYSLPPAAIAAAADQQPSTRSSSVAAGGRMRWTAVVAACGVAALAAGWFGWRAWLPAQTSAVSAASDAPKAAQRLSLVVLPFENLSGDKEQDYFADGITDDLTTDLSHLSGSFVIARNTAFTYKGKPVDVKQLGRELGVRYVLEGSVRRVGETITVNAQLISTETGAHVWADRFDGDRAKLGQLQVEFVARLANSLGVELVKAEGLRVLRERPNNPDAVDLVMRGWSTRYLGWTEANLNAAIDDFERALRIDPQLPTALAGLSLMLCQRGFLLSIGNPGPDADRAEALAAQTLVAHPDYAQAHHAKGCALSLKKQYDAAIAEYEAAIANDRNFADAYANATYLNIYKGHAAEAFSGVETALRLSPRDPFRAGWEYWICHLHTHLMQWDQAIEWCRKAVATYPFELAYIDLAADYAWAGREADARAAVAELLKLSPGYTVQKFANIKLTDNPTFNREFQRIVDGLRKAGLREG